MKALPVLKGINYRPKKWLKLDTKKLRPIVEGADASVLGIALKMLLVDRMDGDAWFKVFLKVSGISGAKWALMREDVIETLKAMGAASELVDHLGRTALPVDLRLKVMRRDGYACTYCGAKGLPLHIDHFIPVSRGGTDDFDNLKTACQPCNLSKGSKMYEEWRP